jgi:transcriptional regulator with XRE-family HTH domain
MTKKQLHDEDGVVMSHRDFKRWRKVMNLSQKEAAQALGLKRRILQYYEKGERNGDPVAIPKTVRLACFAIAHGCDDYRGPEIAREAEAASD